MLILTTPNIEGKRIVKYLGLVSGEALATPERDRVGLRTMLGKGDTGEEACRRAKQIAVEEMEAQAKELGANAVIGVDLDYGTIGLSQGHTMLMVIASGTAVVYQES